MNTATALRSFPIGAAQLGRTVTPGATVEVLRVFANGNVHVRAFGSSVATVPAAWVAA